MIPLISNLPLIERCFYHKEHPFVLKQPSYMRVRRIKEINAVIYCLIAIGILIGIGSFGGLTAQKRNDHKLPSYLEPYAEPKPILRKGNII